MNVKVISVSKPLLDEKSSDNADSAAIETPDDLIAYTARVSNPNNQNNTETAPRLLKYLKKHAHWSPFEMAHVVIEINTTRDIGRQILRHRSFAFQEFSQRYADVSQLGEMFETREARLQDTKNRQNSIEVEDKNSDAAAYWEQAQQEIIEMCKQVYTTALELGIAKEQARAVLPEGLTKSRLYMAGSLRSWIHYCDLRRANGTQKEHMEIAEACWQALLEHFPSLEEE